MKQDDRVRLRHIADALSAVIRFTSGRRREDLDNDQMLIFALVHALQIVGEAASKISVPIRQKHPEISWTGVIAMRHRLVHAYFDINLDLLWTTAIDAAPVLLAQVTQVLEGD